jgi:hypothetical protein
MDMNELLRAHQIALMQAGAVNDGPSRLGHLERVARYAERIRLHRYQWQKEMPFVPVSLVRAMVSGGRKSMRTVLRSRNSSTAIDSWESEGGAVGPSSSRVPAEISTHLVRQYRVGPYVYSDPELALAELERQRRNVPSGKTTSSDSIVSADRDLQ